MIPHEMGLAVEQMPGIEGQGVKYCCYLFLCFSLPYPYPLITLYVTSFINFSLANFFLLFNIKHDIYCS